MDKHPLHWKNTLMGFDFWKWQRLHDQETGDEQPSGADTNPAAGPPIQDSQPLKGTQANLHECFPFNQALNLELGSRPVQEADKQGEMKLSKENPKEPDKIEEPSGPDKPKKEPPKRGKRRGLSLSDIRTTIPLQRRGSGSKTSLFKPFGRPMRSPSSVKASSPVKSSAPASPVTSRGWFTKPNLSVASLLPLRALLRRPHSPKETTVETTEVPASPTPETPRLPSPGARTLPSSPPNRPDTPSPRPVIPSPRLPSRASSPFPAIWQDGTPAKPLVEFRGGAAWNLIPRNRASLGLDLFWPCVDDDCDAEIDCLSLNELEPLCQFRGLRSLTLVGMLQSYQPVIWQAVWLNVNLTELELDMALEPEILSRTRYAQWERIQEGWSMDQRQTGEPVYYGDLGSGELHPDIGYGEYLDKYCIEKAKVLASAMGPSRRLISVKFLTLSGFMVDADPFVQWFDPAVLRRIHFKGQCVDAGFWLPETMREVTVRSPMATGVDALPVGILKLDLKKDLKEIELRGGKVVKRSTPE